MQSMHNWPTQLNTQLNHNSNALALYMPTAAVSQAKCFPMHTQQCSKNLQCLTPKLWLRHTSFQRLFLDVISASLFKHHTYVQVLRLHEYVHPAFNIISTSRCQCHIYIPFSTFNPHPAFKILKLLHHLGTFKMFTFWCIQSERKNPGDKIEALICLTPSEIMHFMDGPTDGL